MIKYLILLIYISCAIKADWVYVSYGVNIQYANKFEIIGNRLIVGTSSEGIFLSSNNGINWIQSSMNNTAILGLVRLDNLLFAGSYSSNQGVFVSTDSGSSWSPNTLNSIKIACLEVFNGIIFAGAYPPALGVFTSSNNGANWVQNSLNNRSVFSIANYNNTLFAGTYLFGIYKSTDNGNSWIQTSLNNKIIMTITQKDNLLFAGAAIEQGVFVSSDMGNSWVQTSLNNRQVHKLLVVSNYILAGTSPAGVYVSGDNGNNWIQMNSGLAGGLAVHDLIQFGNYIYSASNNGIYRRSVEELTGLTSLTSEIPKLYSLSQNYPNPFNPVTKIKFDILKSGLVNLSVYDMLGRKVETLVNENLEAGTYNADWNAAKYSSGVYFYKLTSGDFTDVKRMVLVK